MHLEADWRERLWTEIEQPWDLIIVGGGITGAGVLREAARLGLRSLLVERADFASGTSSWSSKLVHGGLRYLAAGDWRLTLASVRERQALLEAAPGLVRPLDFVLPMYADSHPGPWLMGAALRVYDLMARRWYAHWLNRCETGYRVPYLQADRLAGAWVYPDAGTDDARLVLRVLSEALADGAAAVNYCGVDSLLHERGRVVGVGVHDVVLDRSADLSAKAVVNATGPWVDEMRAQIDRAPRLRPLRGSHFVFDFARLPVAQAMTLFHPRDRRPLFVLPWEGATVVGTTDVDHQDFPDTVPCMTRAESDYLIAALAHYFPSLGLAPADALASYAGVRPVVDSGAELPSRESRETAIWLESGLLTVTGGKLTTYRETALDALTALAADLPQAKPKRKRAPILARVDGCDRLSGRFGAQAARMRRELPATEFEPVGGSLTTWAELRWSARCEAVANLADLLLRRTRLGLLLPRGGADILDELAPLCREELGWDAAHWTAERDAYVEHWQRLHRPV